MEKNKSSQESIDKVDGLDPLVHSPTRLKIMIVLSAVIDADFTFLVKATGLTRGNLSANLRKLEEGGLIEIEKGYAERVPRTMVKITDMGTMTLKQYKDNMQSVLDELSNSL